jgi:hypothetical protein
MQHDGSTVVCREGSNVSEVPTRGGVVGGSRHDSVFNRFAVGFKCLRHIVLNHEMAENGGPREHPPCSMLTTICRSRSSSIQQHLRIFMNVRDCHLRPGNDWTQMRPLRNCRLPRKLATHTASSEKKPSISAS